MMFRQAENQIGTTMSALTIMTLCTGICSGSYRVGQAQVTVQPCVIIPCENITKAIKYINKHRELIKRMNFMNASLESGKNHRIIFKKIRK